MYNKEMNYEDDYSNYSQDNLSSSDDDISISITDAEETTFVDQMGRFVEETDEEKRRREGKDSNKKEIKTSTTKK